MSTTGKRRILTIVFVMSLAINLLFIGGLIGRTIAGPPARPMPNNLGWIVRHLDDQRKAALRPVLEDRSRRSVPLRREMRAAQREFEQVLVEPELDIDRLSASLTRLRQNSGQFQQEMHLQMIEVLAQLDLDERKQVAQFLRHPERDHRGPRPDHEERRSPDAPPG